MGFNWKAIKSYGDDEVALYRLLGEMMRSRATLIDLDQIRAFLMSADLPHDGWLGLGEALHRTTSGSPVGYDIWLAWLESFHDIDVDDDVLGERWLEFGAELSEPSEVSADFDPNVDVLPDAPRATGEHAAVGAPPSPHATGEHAAMPRAPQARVDLPFDDGGKTEVEPVIKSAHTTTGVLGASPTQLLKLFPEGPFDIRLFDHQYDGVDEFAVLALIKRGLFFGSYVRLRNEWLPAHRHPSFTDLARQCSDEAARILARHAEDEYAHSPQTDPL